jgi:hypothetical protein
MNLSFLIDVKEKIVGKRVIRRIYQKKTFFHQKPKNRNWRKTILWTGQRLFEAQPHNQNMPTMCETQFLRQYSKQ